MSNAFVTTEPDWAMPVISWMSFQTAIVTSRNGVEQRAALRSHPRYSIAFGRNFDASEWTVRRAALISEFANNVVVPLWTRPDGFVSEVANILTIDATTVRSPYKVGSFVYFVESGLDSVFRTIEAVSGNTITLTAGSAYPAIAVPAYTAAALVYPCIVGMRKENAGEWSTEQLDSTTEVVSIEEL